MTTWPTLWPGISRLKVVRAHAVMQPLDAYTQAPMASP
jgi:hypothetical protein